MPAWCALLVVMTGVTEVRARQAIRVGVIGTGCIGLEHIRNLHLLEGMHVSAIADPHEPSRAAALECLQALGDAAGVSVHEDYRELIALSSVDAVIVCTPNDHHLEAMRDVLRTGKHCLVEKPLCTELDACAEVESLAAFHKEAARAAGQPVPVLWCGMEYRYIPAIARLVREAEAGAIGKLRLLAIREHRFPFLRKVGDWNRFSDRTGGTLVEKCCHFFDLMRLILRSEPTRIYAVGGQDVNHLHEEYGGRVPDILDNAMVTIEFASGARASLELCMFAETSKHQEEISLVGTHGKLEAFAPSHGVRVDDPSEVNFRLGVRNAAFARGEWDLRDPPTPEACGALVEAHEAVDARLLEAGNHGGATYEELAHFASAIRGEAEAEVSLADGSLAAMMGMAAHRSIASGMPVLWDDLLQEFGRRKDEARPGAAAP